MLPLAPHSALPLSEFGASLQAPCCCFIQPGNPEVPNLHFNPGYMYDTSGTRERLWAQHESQRASQPPYSLTANLGIASHVLAISSLGRKLSWMLEKASFLVLLLKNLFPRNARDGWSASKESLHHWNMVTLLLSYRLQWTTHSFIIAVLVVEAIISLTGFNST